MPNRFLASLSPFLAAHLDDPGIRRLVLDSFRDFLRRNVMQYDYRTHAAHFCGSIAYHYQTILAEAASQEGVRVGQVVRSPIEGLVKFFKG